MNDDRLTPARELVDRAQSGDRAAFDELVERSRARLLGWIRSRMGERLQSAVEPEDVLQETYVWAFRSIGRLEWRGEAALEQWLHSIAKHALLKEAARQSRWEARALECEPPRDEISASRAMRREERFARLESALIQLSPDHRLVLELARLRGLPLKEVARRMQRSPDAVSQLLGRALKKLRAAVGDTESLGLPPRSLEIPGRDDE